MTITPSLECESCGWLNGQGLEPADMRWFFAKGQVAVTPSGCYEWTATRQSQGYGWTWDKARAVNVLAHRWSWELANDQQIPRGRVVMHECDNPPCVNPAHLEVGTYSQNTKDAITRGLRKYTPREKCPSGHRYTIDNIYVRSNGERICKRCSQDRKRKARARDSD